MKKCFSLICSLLTSAAAFAGITYDNAYWVIKDGKLAEGITYIPYTDLGTKVPSEIAEVTLPTGENAVEYRQLSQDYLDVKVQFDPANKLDLNKNYIMVLEYMIPSAHAEDKLIEGNKPLFIFGFAKDTADMKDNNAPHSDVAVYIDAKWGQADTWVTTTKYIFSNPEFVTMDGMILSYAREYIKGDLTEFPYIKNLAIVSYEEGVKPFYAEDFDGYGVGEFYQEKNAALTKKVKFYNGGIKPVITEKDIDFFDDEGLPNLVFFRDFQPDSVRGTDGSGYLDDEIQHGIQIESFRDPVVFPGIAIPEGCTKIYSSLLAKKHKNEKKIWPDCDYSEVANMDMPIQLKFNTGEVADLANDTIKLQWTKFTGEIDVPAGATSVDLIFNPMPMGYLADEVILSAVRYTGIKNLLAGENAFEIEAYVDEDGKIVVLNGKLKAVYNMNGRIASENDKIVAIVVENEEGRLASKILFRK